MGCARAVSSYRCRAAASSLHIGHNLLSHCYTCTSCEAAAASAICSMAAASAGWLSRPVATLLHSVMLGMCQGALRNYAEHRRHTIKPAVMAAQLCMHGCARLWRKPCQGVHGAVLLEGLGGGRVIAGNGALPG